MNNQNFLTCYPYLTERLKTVTGVKYVGEVKEFSHLTSGERIERPLDNAVYVIWDAHTPKSTTTGNENQLKALSFSVILTKHDPNPTQSFYNDGVGETLTAICQSIIGFEPKDEQGRHLVTEPFKEVAALPISYEDGFAFFPLRFETEVAILGGNNE